MSEEDDPMFQREDSPSTDEAIGVWYDLERALAGKSGYGGDVAEIYAYRLLPRSISSAPAAIGAAQAHLAGKNMTRLLRRFTKLYHANIDVEEREGFRTIDLGCEEFPPFNWRAHVRVTRIAPVLPPAPPIHEVRAVLAETTAHLGVLSTMLEELAAHRARQHLGTSVPSPTDTDDLPPDAPTGLYLDVPFSVEDLEWIKLALSHNDRSSPRRPAQLTLVFEAIRRDERASAEFLRVMNTVVLPLVRRLRLRDQPQLAKLGAIVE